jgi:hypothetical protein
MILLIPNAQQIKLAQQREKEFNRELKAQGRKHLRNSITAGKGTLGSFVCEVGLRDFYALEFSPAEEKHHYDVWNPFRFGKVENKTKIRTVAPKPEYFGSVAASNTKQQCDFYCFTSILKDFSKMWIGGFMPKEEFYQRAKLYHAGELDPTSDRGWRFKADCWNVPYGEMWEAPPPDKIDERFLVPVSA